jgi:SAM-dependent methyltransferase
MLAVARRKYPSIDWRDGRAESLPFADARFDAVLSQFGLMFFVDKVAALREMRRVLRPRGRLAVAVWDALEQSPGYAAFAALLQRLFGAATADHSERVCVWTLGGALDDAQFERLRADWQQALSSFVAADGSVRFSLPALLVTASGASR